MSSISEFFRLFKDSLYREYLTNLDTKCCQKKIKEDDYNLLYFVAVGCQKFVQHIRILCPGRFILIESVILEIEWSSKELLEISLKFQEDIFCMVYLILEVCEISTTLLWYFLT